MSKPARLLTEKEVAEHYGVVVGTVEKWRRLGIGPAYVKVGTGPKAPVRYRPEDLADYDRKSVVQPKPKENP
jgi:hypothetical protein